MLEYLLPAVLWIGTAENLFLSFLALYKNPKGLANRLIAYMGSVIGIWTLCLYFYEHPYILTSEFWLRLDYVLVQLLIGGMFALSLYFPKKIYQNNTFPLFFYGIFAIIFVPVIMFTPWFLESVYLETWGYNQKLGIIYPYFLLWAVIISVWSFINYIKQYKIGENYQKNQVRYIATGIMLLAGINITLDGILPIFFHNSRLVWISSISGVIFINFTSYALIKHRLLDIKMILARSVSYVMLTGIMFICYVFLVNLAGVYLIRDSVPLNYLILSMAMTFIVVITVKPLNRLISQVTNKVFHKDFYDSNDLINKVTQTVARYADLRDLCQKVLVIISKKMHIAASTIIVLDPKQKFIIESAGGMSAHLGLLGEELDLLNKDQKTLIFDEMEESPAKQIMRKREIMVFFPLNTKQKPIGYLLLGEKKSGDIYFDQDLITLEILSPELAIALENAQNFNQIKNFNTTLQQKVDTATKDLKKAYEQLKELDRLKNDFISIAAHDLRTPTSSAKNYIWLALNESNNLPESTKENLRFASGSIERTLSLTNDMLDVVRIESGGMTLATADFNLKELLLDVYNDQKTKADKKKVDIIFNVTDDVKITSDRNKLHQVISNLVDNAIKYTPRQGKVIINLKTIDGKAEISVSDTGIGIKETDMEKLFTKFGRLNSSFASVSEIPGTGLGLYIAKNLSKLLGGKVNVSSVFGKGSTFTISLPLKK